MVNGARHYLITINNPDAADGPKGGPRVGLLDPSEWPAETVKFCVWQLEVGENGTLHYQMYLNLSRRVSMKTLHSWPGLEQAAILVAVKPRDAKEYCEKEESRVDGPWYYPSKDAFVDPLEVQKRSVRTDLLEVKKRILEGQRWDEMVENDDVFVTYVKFSKGLNAVRPLLIGPRKEQTIGLVLWGSSGVGKSRTARALAAVLGKNTFHLAQEKGSGQYWDGYEAGDVVIIDEMDGSRFTPRFFNELLDSTPFRVPVHGDQNVRFNSKYVIFTSNKHPAQWWPKYATQKAIQRRVVVFPAFTHTPPSVYRCHCAVAGAMCVYQALHPGVPAPHGLEQQRLARAIAELDRQNAAADEALAHLRASHERHLEQLRAEVEGPDPMDVEMEEMPDLAGQFDAFLEDQLTDRETHFMGDFLF